MTSELTTISTPRNDKEPIVFTATPEQISHSGSRESFCHLFPTSKTSSSRKRTPSLLKRALFAGIVLVAFFILQTPQAVAGTGTFQNGKFNFCVSIRFNATPTQIQRIKDVLQTANSILYHATDGQHQFGTISIINNSGASDQGELWILPGAGRGNASDFGYGIPPGAARNGDLRHIHSVSLILLFTVLSSGMNDRCSFGFLDEIEPFETTDSHSGLQDKCGRAWPT